MVVNMFFRLATVRRLPAVASLVNSNNVVLPKYYSNYRLKPTDPRRNLDTHPVPGSEDCTLNDYNQVSEIPYEEGYKKLNDKWNRHIAINLVMILIMYYVGYNYFGLKYAPYFPPLLIEDRNAYPDYTKMKMDPYKFYRQYKEPDN